MNAFLKPEGVQCSTSKMYLIKRQISRSVFCINMLKTVESVLKPFIVVAHKLHINYMCMFPPHLPVCQLSVALLQINTRLLLL